MNAISGTPHEGWELLARKMKAKAGHKHEFQMAAAHGQEVPAQRRVRNKGGGGGAMARSRRRGLQASGKLVRGILPLKAPWYPTYRVWSPADFVQTPGQPV